MSPSISSEKLSTFARMKMPKLICIICETLRMTFCMSHNLYCIPGYLILNFICIPLYFISIELYSNIENFLYYALLYIVGWWSYGANLIVNEHGDDIHQLLKENPDIRVLLVANHQSTADVPLMFQVFSSQSLYSLLWIMDRAFKWTNFGLVSQIHGDYFLNPKNYKPDSIANHCRKPYSLLKNMIIIFPEGGFRYKRLQSSISFATKRNFPILYNVTYPRVNGFRELLKNDLNITHIVDLTICYDDPDKAPSILDIVRGRNCTSIHFHYKIHDLNDNSQVNYNSDEWLHEQWQKKEALLRNHYEAIKARKHQHTNHFSNDSSIDSNKSSPSSPSGDDRASCCGSPSVKQQEHQSLLRKRNDISPVKQMTNNQNNTNNTSNDSAMNNNISHNDKNDASNINHNNVSSETSQQIQTNIISTTPLSTSKTMENVLKFRSHYEFNDYHFDIEQGRPIKFSFIRTLCYHIGFFSVCMLVYVFIIKIIVPMF